MSTTPVQIPRVVPGLLDRVGEAAKPASSDGKSSFAAELGKLLDAANTSQQDAAAIQDAFMNGEPVELHQVMIKAEEAGVTMDLLLEIRNRLVSAYNEVIRMPM